MEIRKVLATLWLISIAVVALFVFDYEPVTPFYGPVTTQTQPTTTTETPAAVPQMIVVNQKAIDAAKSSALYTQTLTALILLLGSAVLMFARKYERPFIPRLAAGVIGIAALGFSAGLLAMSLVPSQEFPAYIALPAICAAALGPVLALLAPGRQTIEMVGEAAGQINGLVAAQKEDKQRIKELEKDLGEEQSAHEKTFEELEAVTDERESAVSEVSSLKEDLELVQVRAAKAEFTSLAGSAQVVLAQKQCEYDEATDVLSRFDENTPAIAAGKRASVSELALLANRLSDVARESAQKVVVLQYVAPGSDELSSAEATAASDKKAAERAVGVAYLADLDAQAAERRAKRFAEAQRLAQDATAALEEARVDAVAEARRCEIVANAEIKFSEATRLSETAEAQIREAKRIISLVKVGETDGAELYSPTLSMPQTDTIHVVMKASGGSDSALHRTIEPGEETADAVEIPKRLNITLEVVDVSMVNMTDTYRQRHGLPAILPPYGVGDESIVTIN